MDPIRNFTLSCLALVVLIALSGPAFASSSVTVGLCAGPGTHYTTIQAAVNAVAVGGTVKVCPGTYAEQVAIAKNLTLIGTGPTASVVVPPAGGLVTNGVTDIFGFPTAAQIFVKNAAVTISHITVDGANDGLTDCSIDAIGIYYLNSSGTITANAVRNVLLPTGLQGCQDGLAINVESNGTTAVTISNNSVRNYDKNGITVSGPNNGNPGPNATVTGNTVIGLGATTVTAQNGIQIGYGATAKVTSNVVADDIYINSPDCVLCYGSAGILIWDSPGVTITSNIVESTQYGIVPVTATALLTANGTIIKSNHVGGTQLYDAIDVCSDGNTVQSNVIYGSTESGIHVDGECAPSTGINNTVTGNTINEACAGILLGTGTPNTTAPNTFMNVTNTTLAGDVCPLPVADYASGAMMSGSLAKHLSLRPSPYKLNRNAN